MKLYDAARAPSPRRVRIYLAEKGITVAREPVDLMSRAQLDPAYLEKNPAGTVPALELDDGQVIGDSLAICRYFERLHPTPPLFGATPLEEARVFEAVRMIEQDGYNAVVYTYRNALPAFEGRAVAGAGPRSEQLPGLVDRGRLMWDTFAHRLDARLADTEFAAGTSYTYADATGLVTIDFARAAKLTVPDDCHNVRRWHEAMRARPSAEA